MARTGRPSKYSEELANRICEAIALSPKGLNHICKEHADFPDAETIRIWTIRREDFRGKYAHARELQMELMACEIIDLCDDERKDVSGELEMPNPVAVQRARLRVDTRKWLMSKLAPKKYGDKIQQEHSGELNVSLAEIVAKVRKRSE